MPKARLKPLSQVAFKPPNEYAIVLFNDNATTMGFVTALLMEVFFKTKMEAVALMLEIHNKGQGILGIYSKEVATMKLKQARHYIQKSRFPLKVAMEVFQ